MVQDMELLNKREDKDEKEKSRNKRNSSRSSIQ
jgi:hypothetical protein